VLSVVRAGAERTAGSGRSARADGSDGPLTRSGLGGMVGTAGYGAQREVVMLRHSLTPAPVVSRNVAVAYVADTGARVSMAGTLRFDPADPFAVTLTLRPGSGPVAWTFARDLLAEGVEGPAGLGDVRIRPAIHEGRQVVAVALCSPSGHADLELPRSKVTAFLGPTYQVVPAGTESDGIRWDAELRTLLRAGDD
jgi:Streptomyces sporulation and cell division protein, SsgA